MSVKKWSEVRAKHVASVVVATFGDEQMKVG